ncbi:putative membrane protein [Escherichia coli 2-011-08_S3_C3]|nr:putative membrane protein [Escherichia coli 2-011-08_S3_C3]KDT06635.1 putative membrane protein [Escherichia coli 2-011-08_S3_C1]KEM83741.1 putative membrane protein [Escherichia coli 7-233-03_S3_C1]
MSIFLRYFSSVKISIQQLFMLALAMIVIGFLGMCLFVYYILIDN